MILSDNETKFDLLNNEAIAKTVVNLIKESNNQPISIGIHGDWGAGKSSILEMIEDLFNHTDKDDGKKYCCIRFNGWKHQGFEDSKIALMSAIVSELTAKENLQETAKEILGKLWKNINWMTVAKTAGKTALGIATGTAPIAVLSSVRDMLKSTVTTQEGMDNMTSIVQSLAKEDIGILSVGTTPRAYLKEVELFSGVKNVHVALGLHPQLVGSGYDDWELFELLVQQCHYIGEVGLDFSKDYIATKMQQIKTFEKILLLCEQYGNKIVSIHSLKSAATVLEILNKLRHGKKNTYILHWFTGTPVQMEDAINLGCFFSINPKMLKTKSGINLIHKIPPNRILIETDAPFSGEFKNAKQLKNILQDMIDNISMIKGIDLKKYLIHNEETVFAY